jgi:hypothetical protein
MGSFGTFLKRVPALLASLATLVTLAIAGGANLKGW